MHLHTCKVGVEKTLGRELELLEGKVVRLGAGWVLAEGGRNLTSGAGLCFAIHSVLDAHAIQAASTNAMAAAVVDIFRDAMRNVHLNSGWPLSIEAPEGDGETAARARTVRAEFRKRLRKSMGRVARLAVDGRPEEEADSCGLFALIPDFESVLAGTRIHFWGQRRMKDKPGAPSRSYLKVEEAYGLLGYGPKHGESVVDLGAAPGGWSFSAAERGALVRAVDNGPLKGVPARHPAIRHIQDDAFRFRLHERESVDWLYCDLIEDPFLVLDNILLRWLDRGWCRHFIVNLKIGKVDPIRLLEEINGDGKRSLSKRCGNYCLRQLFHDREEITCVGQRLK